MTLNRPLYSYHQKRRRSRRIQQRLALVMATLLLASGLTYYIRSQLFDSVQLNEPVVHELSPGTPLKALAADLEKAGLLKDPLWFRVFVRFFGRYESFKAGLYRFEGQVDHAKIVSVFQSGTIYEPVVLKVLIPEGFTFRQIGERLQAQEVGDPKTWRALFQQTTLLREVGLADGADGAPSLEGFLFPAIYEYTKMPDPRTAVVEMMQNLKKNLPVGYADKIKKHSINKKPVTLYQAMIVASLIEKETKFDDEKPMVAEVIWSRLDRGEALGIDASIIYGIEGYDGNIRWKDLRDARNLYNTRIHRGLPPSPICSPGKASIEALLNPTDFGYLFYVADPKSPGRHVFTKNLADHNRAVKDWVKSVKSGN